VAWEPDYVTLAEAKTYLNIADTNDDSLIAMWITTASRAVDTFCHRQFGQVDIAEARTYNAVWDRYFGAYAVEIDDVMDLTGAVVTKTDLTVITDYDLEPVNAPQKGKPYERILTSTGGAFIITALWGWTEVPTPVRNATLIQMARLAARRDSPFGVAGSPSEGSEVRLLATLDPDLKTSLGKKYRREWWAV
jgi:hypothetical protein